MQSHPPTHFVNEKACPSQKQQEQLDLKTCLNNSFQLFSDTLMSKLENLTSKIVEKSPSTAKAKKREGLGSVDNLMMMGKQALNYHQIQKVNLRSR